MPDYKVGKKIYTEEEAANAAESMGLDVDTWAKSFSAQVIAGNQSDPANAETSVGSEENTVSDSVDGSSESDSTYNKYVYDSDTVDVKLTDNKYMGLNLDENGWIVSKSLLEGNNYNWSDNTQYNKTINRLVKAGTHAYDPKTRILHKLPEKQTPSRYYEMKLEKGTIMENVKKDPLEQEEYNKKFKDRFKFGKAVPTVDEIIGFDPNGKKRYEDLEKELRQEYESVTDPAFRTSPGIDGSYIDNFDKFLKEKYEEESANDEELDMASFSRADQINKLIKIRESEQYYRQKKLFEVEESYEESYDLVKDLENILKDQQVFLRQLQEEDDYIQEDGTNISAMRREENAENIDKLLSDLRNNDVYGVQNIIKALEGDREIRGYIREKNPDLYNRIFKPNDTKVSDDFRLRMRDVTEYVSPGVEGYETRNYRVIEETLKEITRTDDDFSEGFDLYRGGYQGDEEQEIIRFAEDEKMAEKVRNEVIKIIMSDRKIIEKALGPPGPTFGMDPSTLTLGEKEEILSTAKIAVLNSEYDKLMVESDKLQAEAEAIENPTQSDIDKYEALFDDLQDKAAFLTSQLDFNVATKAFNNPNFETTKEFEEWRDGALKNDVWYAGYYDFVTGNVQGIRDFGGEYFVGTGIMANRLLLYTGEGLFGMDVDDERARLDYFERRFDQDYKENTFGVSDFGSEFEGESIGEKFSNINWRNSSKMVSDMLPFTLAVASSVKKGDVTKLKDSYKLFGKNNKLDWGIKLPKVTVGGKEILKGGRYSTGGITMNTVRMAERAYLGTVRDNYNEAKEIGMTEGQRLIYANSASMATAIVQSIMPDRNFFNTGAGKIMLDTFKGDLKNAANREAMKKVTSQFFSNLIGEIGEEEAELLLTDFSKIMLGYSNNTGFLNMQTQFETVLGTVLLSGSTSAYTTPGLYKNTKKQVYRNMRADVDGIMDGLKDNVAFYENFYNRALKAGNQKLAARMKADLDAAKAALKHGTNIKNAISLGGEFVTDQEIDLYIEKQALIDAKKRVSADGSSKTTVNTTQTEMIDGVETTVNVETSYDLNGINERIKEIDNAISTGAVNTNLEEINRRTSEAARKTADKLGINYNTYKDDVDADGNVTKSADQKVQEKIDELNAALPERNKGKKKEDQDKKVSVKRVGDNGFIVQYKDGTQEIIINESKSEDAGAVTVAQHEVLHGALNETLRNNPKAAEAMAGSLRQYVDTMIAEGYTPSSYLGVSLQAYESDPNSVRAEEMLTFFSDGLTQGYLSFDENIFTKLGDVIRQTFQNIGIKNVKFDTGRDVYNFIKDYNKQMATGGLRGSLLKGAKKGFKGSLVDGIGAKSELEQITEKIFNAKQKGYGADIVNLYTPVIKRLVFKSNKNLYNSTDQINQIRYLQSEVLNIVKNHNANSKNSLYDKISDLFRPTGTKSTTKSSKDLYSSTETIMGIEGMDADQRADYISNMTKDQKTRLGQLVGFEYTNEVKKRLRKYNNIPGFKEVEDNILADITYGTTKTGKSGREIKVGGIVDIVERYSGEIELNRWINGQLDNKIQGIVNSYNLGKESVDFDTTSKTRKQTIKPRNYRKLKDSNLFSGITLKELKTNVIKVVRVLKTSLNQKISKNVTIPPWIREFKKDIGKLNDLIIKQAMGGLKNNKLSNFLIKNKKAIVENATTTYLGTAIPNALEKSVDGKFTTDWKGKKIDFESSAETGRTSGIELARRKTDISDQDFLSNFGEVEIINGKPVLKKLKRGAKESLAKHLAEEMGLELIEGDVEVQNELAKNQQKHNIVNASLDILQISREIKRGNAKSNRSAEQTQAMLFDLMDMAIKNGGSSDAYLRYKAELPNDVRLLADEIGLDTYFDEGKTGFKAPLLEWSDTPAVFKPYIDTYKSTITAKGKDVSMKQLADFSEALIDILPSELVSVLGDDMFAINYNYLDGADKKRKTGKPGKYNYLSKKRREKAGKASTVKLPFNPSDIEIFNAGTGILKSIATILKKDISADQKRKQIQEKFGDRIAKAEAANIEALKYIMNEATMLIAKRPDLTPGFLRWLESSTSNAKAQRGLTRLPLIQYVDGSMKQDETHVFYDEAVQFAVNRSTNIYEGKSAKFKQETSLEDFIEQRLKNPKTSPEVHLRFKGEHVTPASEVMLELAKISLTTAARINKLGINPNSNNFAGQIESIKTFAGLEMDKALKDYNQTLGAELFSALQDDALGTTSKAGDFRGLAVDASKYNTFTTIDNIQAIEFIKREKLAIDFITELTSDLNINDYINQQNKAQAYDNALTRNKEKKGISVFDFDDTVARSSSKVLYTMPDGKKGKLSATEFAARSSELEAAGAKFDFSEFSKVVKGKPGPLTEKLRKAVDKFGNKNVFILTARPQSSAVAIQKFLKGLGINLKIQNITGLENGAAQAKANWIVAKAAEGYNDFYFADDAYKNVKAVQDALNVLDVKGKVQQAFVKSNQLDKDFNLILEQTKGVEANKNFSLAKAKIRGAGKGRFRFFLPPSAEDFMGLMYDFLGKGKLGEQQKKWIENNLAKPYARGIAAYEVAKQAMQTQYGNLRRKFPEVRKKLNKTVPGTEFTYDQAIRVYLYNKAGYNVPGLSKADLKELNSIVNGDIELKTFADTLGLITNQKQGYMEPGEYWLTSSIAGDLDSINRNVKRKEFIKEFLENAEVIFSQKNLNKIQAIYGENFREALEDILYRMTNGTNRSFGKNRLVNTWSNWLNNSVGAIMFFNMRSAILQTLSTVNFINWTDNNPFKAAAAFANQKQYWADFAMIFNSPKLRERRRGLKTNVNEAELANAAKGAKNKARAVFQYLLKLGFLPTQIADSFAISAGGATMYRNRVNTYLKQGMSKADAETKAFEDFSMISEEAQQSSDPSLISQQQASPLGRFILAFQNTPMQYMRLTKKAARDLVNGRGDWKTNTSKIIYYTFIQNLIFTAMQKALFALAFEEEDYKCEGKEGKALERCQNKNNKADVANSMLDTVLRGSGLYGAVVASLKNGLRQYNKQEEKGFLADHTYTIIELLNLSPPLGSKARKIYSAIQTNRFEKDVIAERGYNLDSPKWSVIGNLVSGFTNLPLDRLVNKMNNIKAAMDDRNAAWKRIAFAMGWNTWDLAAAKNESHEQIKIEASARRKEEGKIKAQKTREQNKIEELKKLDNMSYDERIRYEDSIKQKNKERGQKAADTRRRNKEIADSIALASYMENIRKLKQQGKINQ